MTSHLRRVPRSPVGPLLVGDAKLLNVIAGDVLEQADEVDLLLIKAAQAAALLLADNRQYGGVVHPRVIETVEQMDSARAAGGQAYADLAGEFCVRAGHERGEFFVTSLNELRIALGALE